MKDQSHAGNSLFIRLGENLVTHFYLPTTTIFADDKKKQVWQPTEEPVAPGFRKKENNWSRNRFWSCKKLSDPQRDAVEGQKSRSAATWCVYAPAELLALPAQCLPDGSTATM